MTNETYYGAIWQEKLVVGDVPRWKDRPTKRKNKIWYVVGFDNGARILYSRRTGTFRQYGKDIRAQSFFVAESPYITLHSQFCEKS